MGQFEIANLLAMVEQLQIDVQMNTEQNKRNFSLRRVAILVAIGVVAVILTGIAIDRWRVRDGWCARFYPNGDRKILYGDDCWK
ncbi:hypothetical protein NIES2109_62920 (plasmid) [Nostoc sp. HK-01]|nr:hypothetical protein NIES2109_62920 [Nostoc sp. HK-01]